MLRVIRYRRRPGVPHRGVIGSWRSPARAEPCQPFSSEKPDEPTAFQQANRTYERIAAVPIKPRVMTHGPDFDWNLEEVKAICLRNKASGIPRASLPEAEKR